MKIFYGYFEDAADVYTAFEVPPDLTIQFVYAGYEQESYEGYAFVLFFKDGKLYEVNGNHCSCNDLGDQWEPEETTRTALEARSSVPKAALENLDTFRCILHEDCIAHPELGLACVKETYVH